MKIEHGDLWKIDCDARCVTTNGTVTEQGVNVMGGGCALEAALRNPSLPRRYADALRRYGNHVYLIDDTILFPVKHEVWEIADAELIERSACELVEFAFIYGWERVLVPTPGCGLGGLSWDDVRPRLEAIFDDRFVIVRFENER